MKALTVKQPYAQAIFSHGKSVENRTRYTSHRGWLAIHAGKTLDREFWQNRGYKEFIEKQESATLSFFQQFTIGAIIGVVRLHDVVRDDTSAWARHGQWHWLLRDAQLFAQPIPCRGNQFLWTVSDALMPAVAQMMLVS